MSATQDVFRIVPRPEGTKCCYSLIVVDPEGRPHLPLTRFYAQTAQILSDGTARTYLNQLLPYFTYLTTDDWRRHRGDAWDSPPEAVRESVRDYLVEILSCKAHPKETYQFISLTAKSPSTVRVFLSALKQFYHMALRSGWYAHPHPLMDTMAHFLREVEAEERLAAGLRPKMPQRSGVEDPPQNSASENYFRLVQGDWKPEPIDDPDLHLLLRKGFTLARFCLRDQIVVSIAYESGPRIREILQLTVSDWRKRGCKQEAWACSKGSHGRRVKTIRFSLTTARMLHAYVNTERIRFDQESRRLEELDDTDALFLSSRGNPYDYEAFKGHWYALCGALNIDLNIHQLRHWYTTQHMRLICETATTAEDLERRKEELVRYMAWRNPDTLRAYEHHLSQQKHAEIQDQLHHKWSLEALRYEQSGTIASSPPTKSRTNAQQNRSGKPGESGWSTLLALGGTAHA
jgi:integrase